jgi:7,8-dihydropterin-6-yl-methyl-4-(beta-D-ribofuranosyl)aminobenzene 5'-phosphate synthase
MMRVTCIVDNTAQRASNLWAEHGLAFLIESGDKCVLFDTGQSGTVLLHNLEVLHIEPATIDALVLSHAHNDHAGGLAKLLDHLCPGIPLHAHTDIFRKRYSKKDTEIHEKTFSTTRQALEAQFHLHLNDRPEEIIPGVWTTGGITDRPEPEGRSADHLMQEGDDLVTDAYRDDMALVLEIGDHLMVLCGCCHAGLLNTLAHVERNFNSPIAYIAGGLHLTSASPDQLQHVGEVLSSKSALQGVYPSHCSGEGAFVALSNMLGQSVVHPCPAGTELDLEKSF